MSNPRSTASALLAFAMLALPSGCATGPAEGPAACPAPETSPRPEQLIMPPGLVDGDPARGEALFTAWCTRCHSSDVADRESRMFRGYPRLDCGEWVATVSDVYLFRIISEGGEAFGKQAVMKPFSDELSPAEISDLVAYLRSFQP